MSKKERKLPFTKDVCNYFFNAARSILKEKGGSEGINDEIIDAYLTDWQVPKSLEDVYLRLMDSARNRGGMPNTVFGKNVELSEVPELRECMCNFSPSKIVRKFGDEHRKVWLALKNEVKAPHMIKEGRESIQYHRWIKSIIVGARMLSDKFSSFEEFDALVQKYDKDVDSRLELIHKFSDVSSEYKVYGLGPALASDWLKGMGYTGFSKPDTHIKYIFFNSGLTASENDYDIFKAVDKFARLSNKSPYEVDKLFWLVGSGNFYREKLKIGNNRVEFVDNILNYYNLS